MARKKSIRDIADQISRIYQMAGGYAGSRNNQHFKRAYEIADRYFDNIQKSKSWKSDYESGKSSYSAGRAVLTKGEEINAMTAGYAKADSRKYSQSVYRGIVAG